MAAPVTNEEASDSNQAAVSPISAGSPYRPIGKAVFRNSACEGWFSITDISIGVRIAPGRTAFTRIPCRSEEHTSELQSLMRISYAVFCLKKKKNKLNIRNKKKYDHRNITHSQTNYD